MKSQYSMCGPIRTCRPSRPPEGSTFRFCVTEMGGAPKWDRGSRTHWPFADHHESIYNKHLTSPAEYQFTITAPAALRPLHRQGN